MCKPWNMVYLLEFPCWGPGNHSRFLKKNSSIMCHVNSCDFCSSITCHIFRFVHTSLPHSCIINISIISYCNAAVFPISTVAQRNVMHLKLKFNLGTTAAVDYECTFNAAPCIISSNWLIFIYYNSIYIWCIESKSSTVISPQHRWSWSEVWMALY